jgi:hypothetical protein
MRFRGRNLSLSQMLQELALPNDWPILDRAFALRFNPINAISLALECLPFSILFSDWAGDGHLIQSYDDSMVLFEVDRTSLNSFMLDLAGHRENRITISWVQLWDLAFGFPLLPIYARLLLSTVEGPSCSPAAANP